MLKEDVTPIIHTARRVAVAKRKDLKIELDRQVKLGFIAKQDQPTDWVNSLVITEKKNGQIRLCIDPKDLNKAIKREHVQLPTKEEILSKLTGAKFFSKMDATAGFNQISLDEKSSLMTTFNTPFGRYRYLRLPMGICSAPEVFHKNVYQYLENLKGVAVYIYDIIVWGKPEKEHDERLHSALERLAHIGLHLNVEKCMFKQRQINYLGELITENGVYPDPEKVKAIAEMKAPSDKAELQRFLGMVTYVGRFIPNLSVVSTSLRALIMKSADWECNKEHNDAFENLKQLMTKNPVLQFYDDTKPIKVYTDACKSGIGAVMLQQFDNDWMPIAYASRALSKSEQTYAMIEK